MIDEKTKADILKSISYEGSTANKYKVVIVRKHQPQVDSIIDSASGTPRLRKVQFSLIFSKPQSLAASSNLEIHCCLCGRVISYPAWYRVVKYAVNHFHFFVCCSPNRLDKPEYHQ